MVLAIIYIYIYCLKMFICLNIVMDFELVNIVKNHVTGLNIEYLNVFCFDVKFN